MRILAVDDDAVFLMLLQHVLGSLGYRELVCVNSGAEALALLREPDHGFDCVLLDIEMPVMNGIELCRRIRNMPAHKDLPIVMITAMTSIDYVEPAFRAGANDYVHKPINQLEMNTRLGMVSVLVEERLRRLLLETRLSTDFGLPTLNVRFEDPISLTEAGSVVDWLALENYALTLGRLRLSGHDVIAFRVTNALAIFGATDSIGYIDTMANVASVLDNALRSGNHLIAFAGEGDFVAMIDHAAGLDPEMLQDTIELAMDRYKQVHSGLGIPLPQITVGRPTRAGLFNRTSVSRLFHDARQNARDKVTIK
ncbi:response regulator [Xinfangfangia sp. CPCC 101601]|uniref:Response regulator n=1 Tax=Pseudogemmobacter lacusdianii TaxID=3069608 RepID=A0ABU0VU58_9RHOB|nr:response regulator [Xinfangfangia sp. CPCC 101601]MDQ2065083.1 response regulator [Xinfangfangia sp. CPCC 101601]